MILVLYGSHLWWISTLLLEGAQWRDKTTLGFHLTWLSDSDWLHFRQLFFNRAKSEFYLFTTTENLSYPRKLVQSYQICFSLWYSEWIASSYTPLPFLTELLHWNVLTSASWPLVPCFTNLAFFRHDCWLYFWWSALLFCSSFCWWSSQSLSITVHQKTCRTR